MSHRTRVGEPTDPEGIRALGYAIVDLIADELADPARRPVNPPARTVQEMEAVFGGPVPAHGTPAQDLIAVLRDEVLPAAANYNHPRLICYVSSSTVPLAGLVEAAVSTLRLFPYTWAMTPACTHVETTVVRWLGEMIGYRADAAGYVTTGGSWANLVGLAAARTWKLGPEVLADGLAARAPLTAYVSEDGHSSLDQCVRLLGIGTRHLRRIALDARRRIDVAALDAAIEADRRAGLEPFCVIGNAGTTNTGAVDPLDRLADVAQRHRLWFHVDGAYGAFAALAPETRALFAGLERADSVVCDPHKWLNVPYEAGCVLLRDWEHLSRTFSILPAYLEAGHETGGVHNHWHHGFELTRGDRALKVWMAIRQYGVEAYREMVCEHLALARHLAALAADAPDFELMLEPTLTAVCLRYRPPGVAADTADGARYLDDLNRRLELALIADGGASVSGTTLDGRRVLRACIVNHRVTREGVEQVFALLRKLGGRLHRNAAREPVKER